MANYILLFSQEKHIFEKRITDALHLHRCNIMVTCGCGDILSNFLFLIW